MLCMHPFDTVIQGWNVVNLSFLTLKGPLDQAAAYANLPAAQKAAKKAEYAAAGINIVASAFGETDKPTVVAAYAFRSISSQLVAMMDTEGIDKVVGIGHDFGELAHFIRGEERKPTSFAIG